MQEYPGSLIVLEGSDGSGKGTQFRLLAERLEAIGYDVEKFDFPRYDEPSSYFVRRYLNGDYGPGSGVGPYTASFFFALDRYEAAPKIRQALEQGKIVICNRYVGSNMAHQGSKFTNPAEQRGFFVWADSLEYQLLGIPRPNTNIYLRVPAEISYKLIGQKAARSYTDKTHDEHEGDIEHLRTSVATYDLLCQLFPKDFTAIDCIRNGKLLAVPAVSDLIWSAIKPYLSQKPTNHPKAKVVNLNEPPPSRSSEASKLLTADVKKVRPNYEATLKDISALAERSLLGRPQIAVKRQSTKLKSGQVPLYFIPKKIEPGLAKEYKSVLNQIEKKRTELLDSLNRLDNTSRPKATKLSQEETAHVLDGLYPLAQVAALSLRGSETSLQEIAGSLNSRYLPELTDIAQSLSAQLAISPTQSNRSIANNPNQKKLSQLVEKLSDSHQNNENVRLTSVWPKNEFDILADLLYSESSISAESLNQEISTWSFKQKTEILNDLLQSADQNLINSLRRASYRWDVLSSGTDMLNALDHGAWTNVRIQPATPRYGYDIPDLVELAGIEEEYSECFDLSLGLFSKLQAAGHHQEAQYAVLAGHLVRWQAEIDGLSLSEVLQLKGKSDATKSFRILVSAMQEAAALHHPVFFSARQNAPANESKSSLSGPARTKMSKDLSASPSKMSSAPELPKRRRRRGRPRKS